MASTVIPLPIRCAGARVPLFSGLCRSKRQRLHPGGAFVNPHWPRLGQVPIAVVRVMGWPGSGCRGSSYLCLTAESREIPELRGVGGGREPHTVTTAAASPCWVGEGATAALGHLACAGHSVRFLTCFVPSGCPLPLTEGETEARHS